MIAIDIPDFGPLELHHLVLDYNGTLAVDGEMVDGVRERLEALASKVKVHVVTADTFGKVKSAMEGIPAEVRVLPPGRQDHAKLEFIEGLDVEGVVCIGNGRNDRLMLEHAALGIAVVLGEGAATASINAADIVAHSITDALDVLSNPLRLVATLRS